LSSGTQQNIMAQNLAREAGNLPVSKRQDFMQRTVAYLELHGDYDPAVDAFDRAVDAALRDVVQSAA
jgi:hypothetical protein